MHFVYMAIGLGAWLLVYLFFLTLDYFEVNMLGDAFESMMSAIIGLCIVCPVFWFVGVVIARLFFWPELAP